MVYSYDAYGARTTVTDGEGATNYSYNSYRQLQSETRTFTGLTNNTYTLNYTYNQGDQVKSANYLAVINVQPGAPFTAGPFFGLGMNSRTISGTVTNGSGQPVSGVTVTLSGGQSGTTTTNSSGQYSFAGLPNGLDYTVTPSLSGYVFDPSSRTYLGLKQNITNANFTAALAQTITFDKTINYDYNTVGALSAIGTNLIGGNTANNVLNTITFRASGALKQLNYGNGRRLTMGYNDNRNQPTSMIVDRTNNSADKVVDYAYQYYDANGKNNNRIRQITDNIDTAYSATYTYDNYNRLTNATANAFSRNYQHDPFGNITNFSGLTLNYQTNASGAPATNRIDTDSQNFGYTYDAAGNMTVGAGQSYSYDGANRLKTASGGTSSYGYDGDGKRVKKAEGGATTYYVYSSKLGQSVMEVNSSSVQRAYVYSGSKLVAMQATDGQFYWLHTNHLGNSRAMTDASGNLTYKGQFDPYGASLTEWSGSGNTNLNSKKFTGYERDSATGLDYAQARMYNSSRGRFLTPDPAGLKAANTKQPGSLNRYSYVYNDPVNFIDPTGETPQQWQDALAQSICRSNGGTWALTGFNSVGVPVYNCSGGVGVVNSTGYYSGGNSGNGASSQIRIKPQLYFFEDTSKRKVDTCAGVNYVVNWQLFGGVNLQGGINGWIVQHIKSSFEVKDAKGNVVLDDNGKPVKYTKDFYEAWQVVNGLVFSGDRFMAFYSAARGTKGSFHISATVSFVWNDELTPSPSSWNGNESDAYGLPNRPGNNMPQGWNESAGQKRTLDYSWDCTSPTDNYPKPTFSVTP